MNDDELKQLFEDHQPQLDSKAKQRAINAAMAAFDQAQSQPHEKNSETHQGFSEQPRLTDEQPIRSKTMQNIDTHKFQPTRFYGGLATAAVVCLAVIVSIKMPDLTETQILPTEEGLAQINPVLKERAGDTLAARPTPESEFLKPEEPQEPTLAQAEVAELDSPIVNQAPKQPQPEVKAKVVNQGSDTKSEQPAKPTDKGVEKATALAQADVLAPAAIKQTKEKQSGGAEAELHELKLAQASRHALSSTMLKKQQAMTLNNSSALTARSRDPLAESSVASTSANNLVRRSQEPMPPVAQSAGNNDDFEVVATNPIHRVADQPLSTFSIDVDTASYSFVRRQLNMGVLPQKSAVRLEEMINYFPYDYVQPSDKDKPFSTQVTLLDSPWNKGNKLVHIGIQGYQMQGAQPRSNLVFLLDVSGSMNAADKLPLVKQSMQLLLTTLKPEDTIAIVVYAGAAGTVLEPTLVKEKQKILDALNQLNAGGSTAGGDGIKRAYQLAKSSFIEDGVNRVILATDGDFNVGITNREELKGYVERQRNSGIYLSVLGFGQGNYHDHLMQTLAQNGNGTAAYIDSLSEAQKVLVDEATSTLFPIAKDVKIQVEFNPATVSEYRLLGYETRLLQQEDFINDAVDAGDIGAGHSVTAIYEITPVDSNSQMLSPLRYTTEAKPANQAATNEYGFVKLRYKLPEQQKSQLMTQAITMDAKSNKEVLQEANFATAVAGFAQLLQGGKYTGDWDYDKALALAQANKGEDAYGYRSEFVQLIRKAQLADKM